jgi:hypothetical protein
VRGRMGGTSAPVEVTRESASTPGRNENWLRPFLVAVAGLYLNFAYFMLVLFLLLAYHYSSYTLQHSSYRHISINYIKLLLISTTILYLIILEIIFWTTKYRPEVKYMNMMHIHMVEIEDMNMMKSITT